MGPYRTGDGEQLGKGGQYETGEEGREVPDAPQYHPEPHHHEVEGGSLHQHLQVPHYELQLQNVQVGFAVRLFVVEPGDVGVCGEVGEEEEDGGAEVLREEGGGRGGGGRGLGPVAVLDVHCSVLAQLSEREEDQ